MKFVAAPNANGTGTFSYSVTDSGGTANGGVNTITESIALTVNAVNDAPVASGGVTLGTILEDASSPGGATVASLFGGSFSDATDQVAGGSSANTFGGIAISGYTADAAKGTWQYSTNGGTSWTALGSATTTTAITLNSTDLVRFVPAANYNGSDSFTYKATDGTLSSSTATASISARCRRCRAA